MPTILCIDDNRTSLATRRLLLESLGYSVLTAEDGTIGLSLLLTRHGIDAVVLDSRMPRMDGETVASIISHERPDMPIVVLSGFPDLPLSLVALADAVITKGEPPQVLLDALERLTGTKPERPLARISCPVEETRKLLEQSKEARKLREQAKEARKLREQAKAIRPEAC